MRHAAFCLMVGRGIVAAGAACTALMLAGCSSGVSRFDFPSFNLTGRSETAQSADMSTTAALPTPQESIYGGEYPASSNTQLAHGTPLPPLPSSYRPQATPASYTAMPEPAPAPRAYPRATAPSPQPAIMQSEAPSRGDDGPATTYRVESGDTPASIARKFGVSQRAIMKRNGLERADRLQIGQPLLIPGAKKLPPRTTVAAVEPAPKPSAAAPDVRVVKTTTIPAPGASPQNASSPTSGIVDNAGPSSPNDQDAEDMAASPDITGVEPKKSGQSTNARVSSVDQLPAPDPMSGNSFRWPVQGRVISGFGTKPDGGHNDGINVAVPQGTPVKAAENGVVAYSGSELKGYGNLVLIRHSNNWVSAYAHNEELLVKRGDKVRRGQIVAKAGATGSVSQPQVHFELRKGSRPIDPTKFMNNMAASAE